MEELISNANKLGVGGAINILNNVDLTPSLNTKLNGYILTIENLGTLRNPNTTLVLQKEVYKSFDENNIGYHNKIIWSENPVQYKEFFKSTSKYSNNFYGELYNVDTPIIERDCLDQGFFNFIRQNKDFDNTYTNPFLDYVRFSFPSGYDFVNTSILSGIKSVPVTGVINRPTGAFTGIIDYATENNIYNFNQITGIIPRSFITGNLSTLNNIKSNNNFIYNTEYSGYVIYPQTIFLHQLPKYNLDTVITPKSLLNNYSFNGILLISTGNHSAQKIVYISPHSGLTKTFNTVVESFETASQNFATFDGSRCKKYVNPNDPRSCAWTGFTGVPNFIKISSGISVRGIDVSSKYVNSGFIFPIGMVPKTFEERENFNSNTGVVTGWPLSGLLVSESINYFNNLNTLLENGIIFPNIVSPIEELNDLEFANLSYFVNLLLDSDMYKISGFLRQETPIKDTLYYKLYSGLYNNNKQFNTGTWDGIIPSGTNVYFEYISTNEEPCGTNTEFLLVHKNYGDNSLQDVSIKQVMGMSLEQNTSVSRTFTSISYFSLEDSFWKNFQKYEKAKKNLYIKTLLNNYPELYTQTNRMKRSIKFFEKKKQNNYPKYNTFSRQHSNFK